MGTENTVLTLGDIAIPSGADFGISQTLQPIDNGDLRRTVNGTLRDLTRPENRKFESQVNGGDGGTPALAALWKGTVIAVECISKLRDNLSPAATSITLTRDPVVASVVGYTLDCTAVQPDTVGGTGNRDITFATPVDYVEYRPILTMMVLANSINLDEFPATEGWQIDLEEV